MGLRPGRCYRSPRKTIVGHGARGHRKPKKQKRTWTRIAIKVPRKNYIGAAPALRIRQFNMGNPNKKYELLANLKVKEGFDLRDNAIESARMNINRHLVKLFGKDGFFMKIRVYPSNILRENKTAQGAGADRVSQGMSQSFGKPVGRSARLRAGQIVYSILCMKSQKEDVKKSLLFAKSKFPCGVEVVFSEKLSSIGTLPKKKSRDIDEEKKVSEDKKTDDKKTVDKKGSAKEVKKEAKPEAKKKK